MCNLTLPCCVSFHNWLLGLCFQPLSRTQIRVPQFSREFLNFVFVQKLFSTAAGVCYQTMMDLHTSITISGGRNFFSRFLSMKGIVSAHYNIVHWRKNVVQCTQYRFPETPINGKIEVLRNSRASDRGFAVGAMCEQDVSRVRQKEGAGGWWG